jgi:phosphatidylserine/phosphatidylglycerophosphate/cardiolipin synthase-like enzyme
MKEIIDAANRGVKVTVVTTTGGRHNSKGEKLFGHRNLYNLHILFSSTKTKTNIDAYTFSQAKNGLHKKVVVVDDYVFAGSSNMGTKRGVIKSCTEEPIPKIDLAKKR